MEIIIKADNIKELKKLLEELIMAGNAASEVITPAVDTRQAAFSTEWTKQAKRLAELFAKELKLTEKEYIDSLPKFPKQPNKYIGRFDIPLIIDPRISLKKQCEIAEIRTYIDLGEIINLTKVPEKPYIIWTHDGQKYREYSVENALKKFGKDEVGSTFVELIALYLQYPDLININGLYGIDAGGSRFGAGRVPCLGVFGGGPGAGAFWVGSPCRDWRVLSRGKDISY